MTSSRKLVLSVGVCVLAVAAVGWADGPAVSALDGVAYSRIVELRERLCLRNEYLSRAGLNEAQATALLTAVRDWYDTNKTQLAAADTAANQARQALQEGQRKVNMGKAGGDVEAKALMARLTGDLARAEQARDQVVAQLATAVEVKLTNEQKTVWTTVRANVALGATGEHVYAPGLTAEQVKSLKSANRTRALKSARSSDGGAAEAELRAVETKVLSGVQREAITAARSAGASHAPGVLAADAKVLAVPEELQAPAAGNVEPQPK